jgi:hypothetical protein
MMTAFRRIKTISCWALLCAVFSACGGSPAPTPAIPPVPLVPPDELDAAIREASDYLNRQLPAGNKLVILNIQSEFPALSEYIIDELIANTVNDRFFTAVDRQQLALIRAELDFQMSGDVDDETAQALGRMAGAQIIISGAVSRMGPLYRLRVRALSVQNAQIEGQFNRNIPDGPTISILAQSEATGYGSGANYGDTAQPGAAASGGGAGSGSSIGSAGSPATVAPAPAVTPAAAPPPSATPPPSIRKPNQGTELTDSAWTTGSIRTNAVLYYFYAEEAAVYDVYWDGSATTQGNANIGVSAYWHNNGNRQKIFENRFGNNLKGFRGESVIGKKFDYIIVEVKLSLYSNSGGNFRIRFDKIASPPTPAWVASASDPGLYVNGAFQGQMELLDALDWITLNATEGGYYLIVLGRDEKVPYVRLDCKGLKVTVSLKGAERERKIEYDSTRPPQPMFTVLPGVTFVLEDGVALSGLNANSHSLVSVEGGALVMNGGAVRNNSVNNASSGNVGGSGVRVQNGSFFMNNGTISGNSVVNYSNNGGGVFSRGTFIMKGGTISGNNTAGEGGGVYCSSGIFIMKGGTISGNSAREHGGGVYSASYNRYSGLFFKFGNGGVIYGSNATEAQANTARSGSAIFIHEGGNAYRRRNTTARATTMVDIDISGAEGGWE